MPAYHHQAVHIYGRTLPPSYQHDIGELFRQSANTMDECSIPARLAEDWVIVTAYLRSASAAIEERMASLEYESQQPAAVSKPEIERREAPPPVIHFDELARLTTCEGVSRLHRAAVAVRQFMEGPVPSVLDDSELQLLRQLADGAAIADLAVTMAYSKRSIYRKLACLWDKLGVSGRTEGLHKVAAEGLLD